MSRTLTNIQEFRRSIFFFISQICCSVLERGQGDWERVQIFAFLAPGFYRSGMKNSLTRNRVILDMPVGSSSGVTTAYICDSGSRSWGSDALTMRIRYRRSKWTNSRKMNVGTGSSEQDFALDVITMRRTSASVHERNEDSDVSVWLTTGVCDRAAVEARTSLIFGAKNVAKLSGVTRGRGQRTAPGDTIQGVTP